jgi:hypothetical protein
MDYSTKKEITYGLYREIITNRIVVAIFHNYRDIILINAENGKLHGFVGDDTFYAKWVELECSDNMIKKLLSKDSEIRELTYKAYKNVHLRKR